MFKKIDTKLLVTSLIAVSIFTITIFQIKNVYLNNVFANTPPTSPITPPITTIDLIPPTISIMNPLNNATVSGIVPVDVSAIDDIAVASVQIFVDHGLIASDSAEPYSTNWDTTIYPHNSLHTILTIGYDTSNNSASDSAAVTVVDITSPELTITSPANGSFVPRNTVITIQALASDVSGITNVKFYVNGNLKCTDTASPYSCNWKVPGRRNITYTLSATAQDNAGNTKTVAINVTSQ